MVVRYDRKSDIYFVKWAYAIKKRDHFTCHICSRRGVELNAHHLNGWDTYPDERYDLRNGTTLCSTCHNEFHKIYGYGGNTEIQFYEFEAMSKRLIKAANNKLQVEAAAAKLLTQLKVELDGYR